MTRTDNADGTWDILFDNEADIILDGDIEYYTGRDTADDIWCPIRKESRYIIQIAVPGGKALSNGKKVVNTAIVDTTRKPYISGNFFCYTTNVNGKLKTVGYSSHEICGFEITCEEKEVLRKRDEKNNMLFHYKYGDVEYRPVML